jgi:hypothetical protein
MLKNSFTKVVGWVFALCPPLAGAGDTDLEHRPLTKGRITQQSSPERDEGNAFSQNVFLASRENKKLGTQTKLELIWCNG